MTTIADTEAGLQEALREGDINMESDSFLALLRGALQAVRGTRIHANPLSQLTSAEAAELRRGGLAPTADFGAYDRVRAKTAADMAAILSRALSTAEAATRLGVDPSRVRQLLSERRLLGARDGGEWRVLDVQFAGDGLVPNVGQVASALPVEMPFLAAALWLTSPEPDLEMGDRAVSPIEWLSAGGDPARVADLARDL